MKKIIIILLTIAIYQTTLFCSLSNEEKKLIKLLRREDTQKSGTVTVSAEWNKLTSKFTYLLNEQPTKNEAIKAAAADCLKELSKENKYDTSVTHVKVTLTLDQNNNELQINEKMEHKNIFKEKEPWKKSFIALLMKVRKNDLNENGYYAYALYEQKKDKYFFFQYPPEKNESERKSTSEKLTQILNEAKSDKRNIGAFYVYISASLPPNTDKIRIKKEIKQIERPTNTYIKSRSNNNDIQPIQKPASALTSQTSTESQKWDYYETQNISPGTIDTVKKQSHNLPTIASASSSNSSTYE